MIKEIILTDFFAFKGKNSIRLNPGLNLLLGINGSGKTSFLNAFRLLFEGIVGMGFEKLFQEMWGGFDAVANANDAMEVSRIELSFVFDKDKLSQPFVDYRFENDVIYTIGIRRRASVGYMLDERITCIHNGEEQVCLESDQAQGKVMSGYFSSMGTALSYEKLDDSISDRELIVRQIGPSKRYLYLYSIRQAVLSFALYSSFDTSIGSKIRKSVEFTSDTRLREDGTNLAQLLNIFKNENQMVFERIEKSFRKINPGFVDLNFNNFGARLYMSLREKNMRHSIGMEHLSDGTLRYMLLACILMNPVRGGFIGVDEPEGRLHPDMINSIADMLKEASKDSQLIIATHSPLLLNLFELEDILVFEKNADNVATVKHVYEEDFEDWEGEFLPGQMWIHGVIGGKRW